MRPTFAILLCLAAAWTAEPPPAKDGPKDKEPRAEAPAPHGFLGIEMDEVDEALAYHLKLDNDLGVLVREVTPGSAAEKMGVKMFDVVVGCDGKPIYTPRALGQLMRGRKVGDTVELELRRGAETVKVKGTLQARPPGLEERRPPMPGMERLRRLHEMLPELRDGERPGLRRGRVEKPDGSVMEWSIESDEAR